MLPENAPLNSNRIPDGTKSGVQILDIKSGILDCFLPGTGTPRWLPGEHAAISPLARESRRRELVAGFTLLQRDVKKFVHLLSHLLRRNALWPKVF